MTRLLATVLVFAGSFLYVPAHSVEIPKLKPGLWEMRVLSSAGGASPALPLTVCIGTMPDAQRALEEANIKARCSKFEAKVVGEDWVVDAVCSDRKQTVTKHIVTSLSGERFHEQNASLQGSMTSDGKWLSPCKPGQTPSVFK